jgi:DNA polymerase-1
MFEEKCRRAKLAKATRKLQQLDSSAFDSTPLGNRIGVTAVCEEIQRSGKGMLISMAGDTASGLSGGMVLASTPQSWAEVNLADCCEGAELDGVRSIFADPNVRWITHDWKAILHQMSRFQLAPQGQSFDLMIASYLLFPECRSHSLDDCGRRFASLQDQRPSQQSSGGGAAEMGKNDRLESRVEIVWQLGQVLEERIGQARLGFVFKEIEAPLIRILKDMEQTGVYLEAWGMSELAADLGERIQHLAQRIYGLAGEEFNILSSQQVARILFEKFELHRRLGLRLGRRHGNFSTDQKTLQKLAGQTLVDAILEYRGMAKVKATYVDALQGLVDAKTDRVHTRFHQTGTATGRLSSSNPNLQNIPLRSELGRSIRGFIRAQSPGHGLISADYSQIELRLMAHMAREVALIQAFRQGEDIHAATAARIFGGDPKNLTSDLRARAKAINFGLIYGMGAFQLAEATRISIKTAERFIQSYFKEYPAVFSFIRSCIHEAADSGYVRTLFGRRRPVPMLRQRSRGFSRKAAKLAVNSVIQGSAADLIKLAMIRVDQMLRHYGLATRLILQVHDELVFEGPEFEREFAIEIIRQAMTTAVTLDVPLVVNIGWGASWLEAHPH